MSRKLALKKLKASDLTFFSAFFRANKGIGKQKSITLDRRLIEADRYYPDLKAVIDELPDQIAKVSLTFYGPGKAGAYQQMRKVHKQDKNWRLNGEVVKAPSEDPKRFNHLAPGDIALMEFSGAGAPNAIKIVLLSAANPSDANVHAVLAKAFPSRLMSALTEDDIELAVRAAAPDKDHPIRDWLDRDLLEEVAMGGSEAATAIVTRRGGRGVSRSELKRAKANAEEVGRLGEELLDGYFKIRALTHDHSSHSWTSDKNAVSPYDFVLTLADGTPAYCDAKSTAGPFDNAIHLSMAEIRQALDVSVHYRLYRLYEVKDKVGAKLRIARDIRAKLLLLEALINSFPDGVKLDSLSFKPDYFNFDAAVIEIKADDLEDDDDDDVILPDEPDEAEVDEDDEPTAVL